MGPELICPLGYRHPAIQRERKASKDNVTVDSQGGGGVGGGKARENNIISEKGRGKAAAELKSSAC